MRLNFDRVLRFIVVADELSLTRAAARLNVDQPWLSRQMIQLEEQLGFALFERKAGRIQLTADGAEFLGHAQELAGATETICRRADEMHRRRKLELKIGAAYFTYWFDGRHALLKRYKAIRPEVKTQLSMAESSIEVVELVRSGAVDVGLVIGAVQANDIEQIRLERGETTLSIPEEDPLAQRPALELADLRGRKVAVGPQKNPARYSVVYGWTEEVGAVPVEVPEGRRFMADAAERERLVLINLATAERDPPGFVRLPIRGRKPHVDLYLIRKRGFASGTVDRFWQLGGELAEPAPPRAPETIAEPIKSIVAPAE